MHGAHVIDGCVIDSAQPVCDPTGAVLGREIQRDVVGVVITDDAIVCRNDVARVWVPRPNKLVEGDDTLPLVLSRPSRHREPRVGNGANRDLPAV